MRSRLLAIAVLLAVTLASPRAARSATQELSLSGIVVDATGGVIIGATVSLDGPRGSTRTVLTSIRGEFVFSSLLAGPYRLRVAAPGFAAVDNTVQVPTAEATLTITLQIALTDRVDVSVLSANLGAGALTTTTLSGSMIAALPDDPEGLLRRLQEMAGATGDPNHAVVFVDGFRQTLRLPPKEAIQTIRIISNPYAPEFAELARARIEIVTKPGSATVHGEMRATFNDGALNARNPLAPQRADEQSRQVSGYVSGPIVSGRWSLVAYGGMWSIDQSRIINASGVDPASGNIMALSQTLVAPTRTTSMWVGADGRLNPAHTLNLSGSINTDVAANRGLESGLDLPQRAFNSDGSAREMRMTLTSVLGNRFLHEVRAQVGRRRSTMLALDGAPAILVLDAFNTGGNQTFLHNETETTGLQAIERLTTTVGRHLLKLGFDADRISQQHSDLANFGGTFLFGADFERDSSGTPVTNASGELTPISPLENYRRTILGRRGYGPSQFSVMRGQPDAASQQWWTGWFAQDDWNVHPRLTVSYGVRQEWQTQTGGRDLALRGAMAWAVDDARRNTVRAGVGTFYGRVEPELTLDVLRFDGDRLQQLLIHHPPFFPQVPSNLQAVPNAQPTVYVQAPQLDVPQIRRVGVTLERRVSASGFVTLGYDLQDGSRQLRTRNVNPPGPGGVRADPAHGPILQYESSGRLRRQQFSAGWRWQAAAGYGFANYSYVRGRSDTDGRTTTPADSTRLDLEYGPTAVDRPHQLTVGASIDVLGEVTLTPFFTAVSGQAFNITTGFDNNGDGLFTDRPGIGTRTGTDVIETAYGLLDLTPTSTQQILGRNAGREPAQLRLDVSAVRLMDAFGATVHVALNIENVFNRSNFAILNGVLSSPDFGQPRIAVYPRRVSVSCGFSF